MCRLYKDNTAFSLDDLRVKSFLTTNRQEEVPPTSDAAKHHICRAFTRGGGRQLTSTPLQDSSGPGQNPSIGPKYKESRCPQAKSWSLGFQGSLKGRFFSIWPILLEKRGRTEKKSPKLGFLSHGGFFRANTFRIHETKKYMKIVTFNLL